MAGASDGHLPHVHIALPEGADESGFPHSGEVVQGIRGINAGDSGGSGAASLNIRFGTNMESVRAILAFANGSEQLYIARLDSDDLYHKTFVQQLYDIQPQQQTMALINQNGYLWDSVNNEMAPAFHRSPQFYVYLYKTAEYAAGYRVKLPGRGTHGNVIELPHELLAPRNYVNIVHSSNTSTKKVPPKDRLSRDEMAQVLREFMI